MNLTKGQKGKLRNKSPERQCLSCRNQRAKNDLLRVVRTDEGVFFDPTGKKNGRGVYVCPDTKCIYDAIKNNGFKRSLKRNIDKDTIDKLAEELEEYGQENG